MTTRVLVFTLFVVAPLLLGSCGPQKPKGQGADDNPASPLVDPALLTPEVRAELTDFVAEALVWGTGHEFSALYPLAGARIDIEDEGMLNLNQLKKVGGFPRIAREVLDPKWAAEASLAAIECARPREFVMFCYLPRHALSVWYQGRRVDVVVCLQCMETRCYVEDRGDKAVASTGVSRRMAELAARAHAELGLPAYADSYIAKERWLGPDASTLARTKALMRSRLGMVDVDLIESLVATLGEDATAAAVAGEWQLAELESAIDAEANGSSALAVRKSVRFYERDKERPHGREWLLLYAMVGGEQRFGQGLSSINRRDFLRCNPKYVLRFGDLSGRWEIRLDSDNRTASLHRPDGSHAGWYSASESFVAAASAAFREPETR